MPNHVVAPIKLPIADGHMAQLIPDTPSISGRIYIRSIWLALNSSHFVAVSVPAVRSTIRWYSLSIHKTDKWRFNYFVYRRDMLSSAFVLDKTHIIVLAFPLYLKLDSSSLAASTSDSLFKSKYSST